MTSVDDTAGAAAGFELTLTRVFDAPRALVWTAWTEPETLNRWFHPKDFAILASAADVRPGGAWSFHIRAPDGTEYRMGGTYRAVVPGERIAFTQSWLNEAGEPGHETLVTVTLEDHGSGTRLTFHQAAFRTAEARDSHIEGWEEVLDLLAADLRREALPA